MNTNLFLSIFSEHNVNLYHEFSDTDFKENRTYFSKSIATRFNEVDYTIHVDQNAEDICISYSSDHLISTSKIRLFHANDDFKVTWSHNGDIISKNHKDYLGAIEQHARFTIEIVGFIKQISKDNWLADTLKNNKTKKYNTPLLQ